MLAVMSPPAVTVINIMMALSWRGEEEAGDFVLAVHLCRVALMITLSRATPTYRFEAIWQGLEERRVGRGEARGMLK